MIEEDEDDAEARARAIQTKHPTNKFDTTDRKRSKKRVGFGALCAIDFKAETPS